MAFSISDLFEKVLHGEREGSRQGRGRRASKDVVLAGVASAPSHGVTRNVNYTTDLVPPWGKGSNWLPWGEVKTTSCERQPLLIPEQFF